MVTQPYVELEQNTATFLHVHTYIVTHRYSYRQSCTFFNINVCKNL